MRRLLLILSLAILALPVAAQRIISADVETKSVSEGKVTTTRKHVCCTSGGRLVSHFFMPLEYYAIELSKGEARYWLPGSNQVYTEHTGSTSSKDEVLYIFLSRMVQDMGLLQYGYTLKSSVAEKDGYLKKTFVTDNPDNTPVVEVVYKDFQPVYMAYRNTDGRLRGRWYYSNYKSVGRISVPSRTTEILYPSPKDSIVTRSIYSNLVADSDDPLATFEIPSDAKPMSVAPTASRKSR